MNINEADESFIEPATSFLVKIQYRQNTSWQGTIKWLDGQQTRHFRSCLEMMMLIEDALTSDRAKSKTIEFNTWDEEEEVKLIGTETIELDIKRRKIYAKYGSNNKNYK